MTRKEYEALISQPNVIAEDLLDNLNSIVCNETVIIPRVAIVPKLKQNPIPQPFFAVGMSVQQYYKLDLSKQEADCLLDVIHMAQRTNDKKAVYKPDILRSLEKKWQKYCASFG